MVVNVFREIRSVLKIDLIQIDNIVFRLHYKVTCMVLIIFSSLLSCYQFFGVPIKCDRSGMKDFSDDYVSTFCWIDSLYSVKTNGKTNGKVAYWGLGNSQGQQVISHRHYQWICFMLFFQAMLCYVPRYLWKVWEGGLLKALTINLNMPILSESDRQEQIKLLVNYLKNTFTQHNLYFFRFVLCELINLLNIILQIFMVDSFLGGIFLNYGSDLLDYLAGDNDLVNPMTMAFPRLAKCAFGKYGQGGSIEKNDLLCLLPLNILNEKIFIILWFWFIILSVITGLLIIYRIVIMSSSRCRYIVLKKKINNSIIVYDLDMILEMGKIGDWWLLYMLNKNLQEYNFRIVIKELAQELNKFRILEDKITEV